MKRLILSLLLLCSASSLHAQTFLISTTPESQSVKVGETAKFSIKVMPQNGYDATVFGRAVLSSSGRQLTIKPDFINSPYSSAMSIELEPLPVDIGNHKIYIEAWNGLLRMYDTVSVSIEGFPDRPGWRRYTTGNSPLPSDSVIRLEFDTDGNAWIGTTRGLAKFDGENWSVFRAMNNGDSVLTSDSVWALAVDSSNVVWVGSPRGVSRRAGNDWTVYKPGKGFPLQSSVYPQIVSMASSPDLKIYALGLAPDSSGVISDRQVWSKEGETWTKMPVLLYVSHIAVDAKGRLYTLNQDTLTRYDGQSRTVYPYTPYGRFGPFMDLDRNGNVWTTTSTNKLIKLEGGDWKIISPPGSISSNLMFVASDHANGVWVSNRYTGIVHYDGTTWSVHDFSSQPPQPSNMIRALRAHRDGTVWAGTYGGGLLVFDPYVASGVETPKKEPATNAPYLSIFPNPVTGTSNVHYTVTAPGNVHVAVINPLGEVAAVLVDGSLEQGEHVIPFDTSQLPAGVYYVRMSGGGSNQVQTIIVGH